MYAALNFHQFAILPHKHPLSNTSPYSASATDFNSFIYQFMDLLDLENMTMEMAYILPTFTINQATLLVFANPIFAVFILLFKSILNLLSIQLKKF